jgi:tight adherence protein C
MELTPQTFAWIAAAAAGLSAALAGYLVSRLITDVPQEDRSYRDRPPLAFRLAWWPIQWIAFYLGKLMPARYRQRVLLKLRLAGLDYTLLPEQFEAARVVLALVAVGFVSWASRAYRAEPAWWVWLAAAGFGLVFPMLWLTDRIQARRHHTLKTLPFYLDLITLCVEAGLNLTGALQQAVNKGPEGPLRDEITRILRDIRAGRSRPDSFRAFAERLNEPAVTNLVSILIQAENTGMNLGPVLRAQADQRRVERFARAEKAAAEAPVKLLLPLIGFIFPCVFIVIGFPIAMKFMAAGM